MNSTDRELLRISMLRYLAGSKDYGLTAKLLHGYVKMEGFHCEVEDVTKELLYLQDKFLVTNDPKIVSPENKRWRVTAQGRDFLAQEGIDQTD